MVVVAVAGGTGAVGRTIVSALVDSGMHDVFVLSRGHAEDTSRAQPRYLVVDYNNVNGLESVLRDNNVQVVVSALVLLDEKASDSQINLIRGAAQSGTVEKFIPSEYHLNFHTPIHGIELSFKQFQLQSEQELERHPQLTWTLIRNGLFLDYLGMPFHPKPTNLMPYVVLLDLQNELCVVPGGGTMTMIFTHSQDLAAFIERLIRLPANEWPRESLIAPNKIKVNDLVQIVKDATGRDFKVVYDSADTIYSGHITQLPTNKQLFADPTWGKLYQLVEKEAMFTLLSDGYNLHGKNLADLFPEVETTNIEDFIREAWSLKVSSLE